MKKPKQNCFDLETIITITSGRAYTTLEKTYNFLDYLTNDTIYSNQVPRVLKIAKEYLLTLYPMLKDVGVYDKVDTKKDAERVVNNAKALYGDSFIVEPLPSNLYEHIDYMNEYKKSRTI